MSNVPACFGLESDGYQVNFEQAMMQIIYGHIEKTIGCDNASSTTIHLKNHA